MKKFVITAVVFCTAAHLFSQNLDDLHNKVIKFYQYQRAGLASGSANNANSGFTNASHNGDSYNGNPLDGGWYDAGDYIKFGMNLSYSVYSLLKGYDVFPNAYASSGGVPNALEQAKFATDYICKAVIDANTIVLDVGIASEEHNTWGVTNAGGRTGNKIRLCDGGDIPATYAACLALMSVLYRKYDEAYADKCLERAKVAFAFAKKKFNAGQNYCSPQLKNGAALYDYPTVEGQKNQQIGGRMVAAGIELYRATLSDAGADPTYKQWATKGITNFFNCMGFSYIGPLASFEAWRQGLTSASSLNLNLSFIEGRIRESGAFSGVFQNTDWGTARDIGTVAFEYGLGYVVSGSESTREKYLDRAKAHVSWLTGETGQRSYICGVNGGPTRIHYRTTDYGAIPGAVVAGPDDQGGWSDDGSPNYCEVAIDYNAGICGAVAFLKAVNDNSVLKASKVFEANPTTGVDLTSTPVAFTCGFSKTVGWTITINGAFGKKEITGNGTSVNESWDGSADDGFFLAGEIVKARLTTDEPISALDLQKVTPVSIELVGAKKVEANPGDKLVDDFDDSDTANSVTGAWTAFGTGTGLTGTSLSLLDVDGSVAMRLKANVPSNEESTYSGIRTTFNAEGTATAIGDVKSIMFDMKGQREAYIRVELEQADITDGAYHGMVFPVLDEYNSYRIPVSGFAQPDWKTADVPLDLDNITALRFMVYDSTGRLSVDLDNLYIEDLAVSATASNIARLHRAFSKPVYANSTLSCTFPPESQGAIRLNVFDLTGRVVFSHTFNGRSSGTATVPLGNLPGGMYNAVYSTGKKRIVERLRFYVAK